MPRARSYNGHLLHTCACSYDTCRMNECYDSAWCVVCSVPYVLRSPVSCLKTASERANVPGRRRSRSPSRPSTVGRARTHEGGFNRVVGRASKPPLSPTLTKSQNEYERATEHRERSIYIDPPSRKVGISRNKLGTNFHGPQ